jgi:NADP-dependent 3-hydroxy acid dehydrogenase YdfG
MNYKKDIKMRNKNNNKVVITGASSGIGSALAKILAKDGYELTLLARRKEKLESLAKSIKNKTIIKTVDVTDYSAIEMALVDQDIDILINSAGVALGTSKFYESNLSHINKMIDTNIKGITNLCRYVLPKMIKKNSGYIFNIGSVLGTYPFPYAHVYGATKSFVEHLSLNLRADLIGTKVRVTLISPGTIQTEFHEKRCVNNQTMAEKAYMGIRPLNANEIANIIHYCLKLPAHVNINKIEVASVDQNLWASF